MNAFPAPSWSIHPWFCMGDNQQCALGTSMAALSLREEYCLKYYSKLICFVTEEQIKICWGAQFSWEIRDVNGKERGLRGDKKEERKAVQHACCSNAIDGFLTRGLTTSGPNPINLIHRVSRKIFLVRNNWLCLRAKAKNKFHHTHSCNIGLQWFFCHSLAEDFDVSSNALTSVLMN